MMKKHGLVQLFHPNMFQDTSSLTGHVTCLQPCFSEIIFSFLLFYEWYLPLHVYICMRHRHGCNFPSGINKVFLFLIYFYFHIANIFEEHYRNKEDD